MNEHSKNLRESDPMRAIFVFILTNAIILQELKDPGIGLPNSYFTIYTCFRGFGLQSNEDEITLLRVIATMTFIDLLLLASLLTFYLTYLLAYLPALYLAYLMAFYLAFYLTLGRERERERERLSLNGTNRH